MDDPYDLDRFVVAQQDTYDDALDELRRGRKRSHWMWFVFPQVAGDHGDRPSPCQLAVKRPTSSMAAASSYVAAVTAPASVVS